MQIGSENIIYFFLSFFYGAGAQTQGLVRAKQTLYHWDTSLEYLNVPCDPVDLGEEPENLHF